MNDRDLILFYKTEFKNDWQHAYKNGLSPSIDMIEKEIGIKRKKTYVQRIKEAVESIFNFNGNFSSKNDT